MEIKSMNFVLSQHAEEQMLRRCIDKKQLLDVLGSPDEIVTGETNEDIRVYQSIFKENEQLFLLRVFVNINKQPNMVITVYKTTKIYKYYEAKI
ncbi:MAG: hypothetical protein EZS26_001247 [Candidatus Ordinivivax streblomastigis]|uniref:DUF4258 domain-containing protein n=1 Tax=Candidatus Ordinivivax streblomastigis TaxID=2540710 RepID=A0A5M8P3A8_9BACT|nr:MAG: hypothetical protein EZS26_001247 [Candidatus Ordinivivax streblomastigis]